MSEKEFEQDNEELFNVVNGHATPEAAQQAEEIAESQKHPSTEERERFRQWMKENERKARRQAIVRFSIRAVLCIVAVFLFLAALLLPNWVPVLCFSGLAVCLIVGAIMTDRFVRGWKRWP